MIQQCDKCGADFEGGKGKKYCSAGCRPSNPSARWALWNSHNYYSPCRVCGEWFEHKRKRMNCSRLCASKVEHICECCGAPRMILKSAFKTVKYCRTCANKYRWVDRQYPEGVQSKADRAYVVAARYREHCKAGYRLVTCPYCQALFKPGANRKYCSDLCTTKVHGGIGCEDSFPCTECGTTFTRKVTVGSRPTICSAECRKESKKRHKRKAKAGRRKYIKDHPSTQSIDPYEVFERDGWICVACGCDTPKSLRGSYDDNAPELDHVIPISRGGMHIMSNLQCLCRLCNQLKGDRSMEWLEKTYIKQTLRRGTPEVQPSGGKSHTTP